MEVNCTDPFPFQLVFPGHCYDGVSSIFLEVSVYCFKENLAAGVKLFFCFGSDATVRVTRWFEKKSPNLKKKWSQQSFRVKKSTSKLNFEVKKTMSNHFWNFKIATTNHVLKHSINFYNFAQAKSSLKSNHFIGLLNLFKNLLLSFQK